MADEKEEYELIPLSPLRRMEKRISELESAPSVDSSHFFKELVSIVRMNQELVEELAKANDSLRIEISKLPGKIEELIEDMKELISFIKASATEEMATPTGESLKPLLQRMDSLIEENKKIAEGTQVMIDSLDDMKKTRRPKLRPMRRSVMPNRKM